QTTWIPNLRGDAHFVRAAILPLELQTGFGFPVLFENEVRGVVEFLGQRIPKPDEELIRMLSDIGSQIGQFIERKWAEEGMRSAQRRLQDVVTSSPAVLFTLGVKDGAVSGVTWMSGNVTQMLGFPVEETYGVEWWMGHVHPDELQT